ncbi:MAG: hypothetical protein GY765_29095 [bacterium]|nr:hypothetical protein [bacterium]
MMHTSFRKLYLKLSPIFTVFILTCLLVGGVACGKTDKPVDKPVKEPTMKAESVDASQPVKPKNPAGKIAHFSDIHFNPFYDTTLVPQLKKADASQWEQIYMTSTIKGYGDFGKDETNFNLLTAALQNTAKACLNHDFIIFTGDFLAHDYESRYKAVNSGSLDGVEPFIDKTISFMALMVTKYLPGVPVYFTLGNNDCYSGDYNIIPEGAFLKNSAVYLSDIWLKNPINKESFSTTYPIGGYYMLTPPKTKDARIISLNTNFFSVKYKTDFTKYDPGLQQLQWFEEQLKTAKASNLKVWLLLHIPPGGNIYGCYKDKAYKPFWKDEYNTRYLQLLRDYSTILQAGFCGHTHMDDFRVIYDVERTKASAFIHICPAVSPQFGNNTAFLEWQYDRTAFVLSDYNVFYQDVYGPTQPPAEPWLNEYAFNKTYGQSGVNAASMESVYRGIKEKPQFKADYMKYYDASHCKELTEDNFPYYWCGIGHLIATEFESCTQPKK